MSICSRNVINFLRELCKIDELTKSNTLFRYARLNSWLYKLPSMMSQDDIILTHAILYGKSNNFTLEESISRARDAIRIYDSLHSYCDIPEQRIDDLFLRALNSCSNDYFIDNIHNFAAVLMELNSIQLLGIESPNADVELLFLSKVYHRLHTIAENSNKSFSEFIQEYLGSYNISESSLYLFESVIHPYINQSNLLSSSPKEYLSKVNAVIATLTNP